MSGWLVGHPHAADRPHHQHPQRCGQGVHQRPDILGSTIPNSL